MYAFTVFRLSNCQAREAELDLNSEPEAQGIHQSPYPSPKPETLQALSPKPLNPRKRAPPGRDNALAAIEAGVQRGFGHGWWDVGVWGLGSKSRGS